MMKFANFLTISVLLVVLYCTVQCSAIKCYHCHSYENSECGDPFDVNGNETTTLTDCDTLGGGHTYTYCRKTIQSATLRPDETVRVIRSCGFLPEPKLEPGEGENPADLRCFRRTGTFGVELLYCACHEDGCNSANWATSSGMFGLVLLSTLVSLIRYQH